MLNNITGKDNFNNVKDQSAIAQTGMNTYSNKKVQDKSAFFVDETDISKDAMTLYERDLDIKKFTNIALSDFDSIDNDRTRVFDRLFSIVSEMRDSEFAESLLSNEQFKKDLLG